VSGQGYMNPRFVSKDELRRIVELEAELSAKCQSESELRDELEALKERRCETCRQWDKLFCDNPESLAAGKLSPREIEFSCSEWEARQDGES
jgi:hypothetical protein